MAKTYVVSDMHIGYEKVNYDKIWKFFEIAGDDADKIILNGDILDLWRMSYEQIKMLDGDLLQAINMTALEVPMIWIRGNHDWRVPQKEFPNIYFWTSYDSGGVHYEHGHRFDLEQRKCGGLWDWIVAFYPPLYQRFFRSPSEIVKVEDAPYWFDMHDEAMKYAVKHQVNVVVGHSHSPQIKRDGLTFVADTGDWIDSCSYLVVEGGEVELFRI